MGAWGWTLQDNDTAQDAIVVVEQHIKKNRLRVPFSSDQVRMLLKYGVELDAYSQQAWGVLGVADYLRTEYRVKFDSSCSQMLRKLIIQELRPSTLAVWKEPAQRKRAILDFRAAIS